MDQRKRKIITMHYALHPDDDVDSTEGSVDASIQRLEDYTEKRGGKRITANKHNTDKWINRMEITRK